MSSAARNEHLAVLVHEVRSPTAALAAIAETIRGQSVQPEGRRELVRLALAACRGIERIVTDLGSTSVRLEDVDLVSAVRDAAAAAALAGARVRVEAAPQDALARADPLRLRQALDNLLSNALLHGGGEVLVALETTLAEHRIVVSDEGGGVPPEARERIFERGARLDETRPGSGLGLAVARAVAEAHGGSLVLQDRPGGGATFVLSFPRSTHFSAWSAPA